MTTLDRIRTEWLAARKAKDAVKAGLLGTLVGAIETKTKTFNPAREVTEAEVLAEVKKMLDGVIETAKLLSPDDPARAAQREQNAREREVLSAYMPQQMTEAEIEAFATAKKAEGMNMGAIMAALKSERAGAYDGKLASAVVKRVLG